MRPAEPEARRLDSGMPAAPSPGRMYRRDTIAAIATPAGSGAIAILRVSGAEARALGRRLFRGFPESEIQCHRLYSGRIVDARGETLDRGLGVIMVGPRSSTGEDVLELHCHGGAYLSRLVLEAAIESGARMAGPGEFTARAFLNGKIDLAQAESVADLVAARSRRALRAAEGQLSGVLSRAVASLRERLVHVAARVELAVDFVDEDVQSLDRNAVAAELAAVAADVLELAATYDRGRLEREGPRVVIVGKPNVGKSSLLNRLLGRERAIVSSIPGTTRDVLEEEIEVDGVRLVVVDTAGIRRSSPGEQDEQDELEEVELLGIERSAAEIARADATVLVVDGSRPIDAEDHAVASRLAGKPCVVFANKSDLGACPGKPDVGEPIAVASGLRDASEDREEQFSGSCDHDAFRSTCSLGGADDDGLRGVDRSSRIRGESASPRARIVHGSARTGHGMTEILRQIKYLALSDEHGEVFVGRARHRDALLRAGDFSRDAVSALRSDLPAEIVAVSLSGSLSALGEITGGTACEEILDQVFREFCIGK